MPAAVPFIFFPEHRFWFVSPTVAPLIEYFQRQHTEFATDLIWIAPPPPLITRPVLLPLNTFWARTIERILVEYSLRRRTFYASSKTIFPRSVPHGTSLFVRKPNSRRFTIIYENNFHPYRKICRRVVRPSTSNT